MNNAKLTMDGQGNPKEVRLRIELVDFNGNSAYVEHDDFFVRGAETGYM